MTQKPIYLPNINLICASSAGKAPKIINVTGKNIHWVKIVTLLNLLTPSGIGGNNMVLKTAETTMPINERVITRPVKIGKLKDKTVKLNLFPPNKKHEEILRKAYQEARIKKRGLQSE